MRTALCLPPPPADSSCCTTRRGDSWFCLGEEGHYVDGGRTGCEEAVFSVSFVDDHGLVCEVVGLCQKTTKFIPVPLFVEQFHPTFVVLLPDLAQCHFGGEEANGDRVECIFARETITQRDSDGERNWRERNQTARANRIQSLKEEPCPISQMRGNGRAEREGRGLEVGDEGEVGWVLPF